MRRIKVIGFEFRTENGKRELVVDLNNGSSWVIGDDLSLRYNGEDRTATKAERRVLQIAVDAFIGFLDGEPEEYDMSYGELACIGELADNFEWSRYPEPTEEEGGPSFVLSDCAIHFMNL